MTSTPGTDDDLLGRIDFGRFDAESDPNILDYFLVTGTARQAAEGAQLVIGRKGSGKTALFRHLSDRLAVQGRVIDLDLAEYVFRVHRGLIEQGLGRSFAYTSSWRLLILTAMYLEVRKSLGWQTRRAGDAALRTLGLGPNSGPFRAMLEWFGRVRRVDLPSIEGLAGLGGIEIAAPDEAALDVTSAAALTELEKIVGEASRAEPITVLVDRLDDAWDGSDDSLDLITGAVRATRQIAVRFAQTGPAPVITFLRTDLWEKLSFNDRNKMSQDTIYLDWDVDGLAGVVDRRIHKSGGVPEGDGWDAVFSPQEMRQRMSPKTYITKRTVGRPRDIVAFCTFALREARSQGRTQIEKPDIYAAEQQYSKHMLEELRDEIEGHVSDYGLVINTLKTIGKRTFSSDEWLSAAANNGLEAADAEEALEQLFEASLVGVHRTGGASGGSGSVFRYQDRHLRSSPDALLQVHLAFVRELGLRDS